MSESDPSSDYTAFGTLRVPSPSVLPEVIDVLIAGGGPAGTAAAMRAHELGLSCLVLDIDDLMRRIRDYAKDKPIFASFGGGDSMPFPPGGPLVSSLHFDEIDKDELVDQWKQKYRDTGLAAKVGSELTGLAPIDADTWEVKTHNHRAGRDVSYRAKHVVIAIGAGVPRRFDIPGNTDGISFRLDDAAKHVGAPALVIGGGTSAAEAVIAISKAKAAANDATAVYWSYRGDRLPKVSRALNEAFFDAYVGNGNIRYLSFSEPTAVVTGPDKNDYLSLRVDRKVIAGRPAETVHLEFLKSHVVACIGEDVQFKLLQSFGAKISMMGDRPLILVNKEGEASLRGVFLVGDTRGARYLQCTDFNDSRTYEQIVQKRNIKLAMWDAVQAIEVIARRSGKGAEMAVAVAPTAEEQRSQAPVVTPPIPKEPADAKRVVTQLVRLMADGTAEESFALTKETTRIGRSAPEIVCAQDVYMADHHATLVRRGEQYSIEDTGTGSGVWIRVPPGQGRALAEGDTLWVGTQILMVAKAGHGWAVSHYNSEGVFRATHPIGDKGVLIGRVTPIPLDAADMALSRRHAQLRIEDGTLKVFDLGSLNGSYVKISSPLLLINGDEIRIASQRFRFESVPQTAPLALTDVVVDMPHEPAAPVAPTPVPAAASTPAAPGSGPAIPTGMFPVSLEHAEHPASFGVAPGQDLLHAYFEYIKLRFPDRKLSGEGDPVPKKPGSEALGWDCKKGFCGACAVQIKDGADNFVAFDPGSPEMRTITNVVGLDPDPRKYRLACLAKITGPVKLCMPQ